MKQLNADEKAELAVEFINSIVVDSVNLEAGWECTVARLDGTTEYAPDGTFTMVVIGHKK